MIKFLIVMLIFIVLAYAGHLLGKYHTTPASPTNVVIE